MTYHTLRGNNLMTRSEKRWALLALGIFLYGCALVLLTAQAVKPTLPVFNCQEDELLVWKDARETARCVNIEEYEQERVNDG